MYSPPPEISISDTACLQWQVLQYLPLVYEKTQILHLNFLHVIDIPLSV